MFPSFFKSFSSCYYLQVQIVSIFEHVLSSRIKLVYVGIPVYDAWKALAFEMANFDYCLFSLKLSTILFVKKIILFLVVGLK